MVGKILLLCLASMVAGAASAQTAQPDPTKPTGIWVLAKDAIAFDAEVLDALAPDCTTTQSVNPTGTLVFSVACPGYTAKVYPQFVLPQQLASFRNALLGDLVLSTGARMLRGGFAPNHPVALHVEATNQVINVYFPKGLDAGGRARDLVRAIARRGNGLIYAWDSFYQADGTHLLWMDSAPESF